MRRAQGKQSSYLRIIQSPRLGSQRASLSAPVTPKPAHTRAISDCTNFMRFGTPADTIVHVPTLIARLNSRAKRDLTRSLYKFESLLHPHQPVGEVPVLENKQELLNTISSVVLPIKSFNQVPRSRLTFCISPKDLSESARIRMDIKRRMKQETSPIASLPLGIDAERSKDNFLVSVRQIQQFSTAALDALKRSQQDSQLDPQRVSEFLEAAKQGDTTSVAQALTLEKRLILSKDSIGQSALHWAAKRNDLPMVKLLKAAGSDLNAVDMALRTPLMLAVRKDYADVVQFLLEAGASKTVKSLTGATAAHMAKEGSLSQALLSRRFVSAQAVVCALLDPTRRRTIRRTSEIQPTA